MFSSFCSLIIITCAYVDRVFSLLFILIIHINTMLYILHTSTCIYIYLYSVDDICIRFWWAPFTYTFGHCIKNIVCMCVHVCLGILCIVKWSMCIDQQVLIIMCVLIVLLRYENEKKKKENERSIYGKLRSITLEVKKKKKCMYKHNTKVLFLCRAALSLSLSLRLYLYIYV